MPGKGDEDQGWPNLSKQGLHVQKISKTSTASEKSWFENDKWTEKLPNLN